MLFFWLLLLVGVIMAAAFWVSLTFKVVQYLSRYVKLPW